MINEKMILAAVKEWDFAMFGRDYCMATPQELQRFAKHFYKQGLLDGADMCDFMWKKEDSFDAHMLYKILRKMAKEVGNEE